MNDQEFAQQVAIRLNQLLEDAPMYFHGDLQELLTGSPVWVPTDKVIYPWSLSVVKPKLTSMGLLNLLVMLNTLQDPDLVAEKVHSLLSLIKDEEGGYVSIQCNFEVSPSALPASDGELSFEISNRANALSRMYPEAMGAFDQLYCQKFGMSNETAHKILGGCKTLGFFELLRLLVGGLLQYKDGLILEVNPPTWKMPMGTQVVPSKEDLPVVPLTPAMTFTMSNLQFGSTMVHHLNRLFSAPENIQLLNQCVKVCAQTKSALKLHDLVIHHYTVLTCFDLFNTLVRWGGNPTGSFEDSGLRITATEGNKSFELTSLSIDKKASCVVPSNIEGLPTDQSFAIEMVLRLNNLVKWVPPIANELYTLLNQEVSSRGVPKSAFEGKRVLDFLNYFVCNLTNYITLDVSVGGSPMFGLVQPTRHQCCNWDTDHDGNCPKHPEAKPSSKGITEEEFNQLHDWTPVMCKSKANHQTYYGKSTYDSWGAKGWIYFPQIKEFHPFNDVYEVIPYEVVSEAYLWAPRPSKSELMGMSEEEFNQLPVGTRVICKAWGQEGIGIIYLPRVFPWSGLGRFIISEKSGDRTPRPFHQFASVKLVPEDSPTPVPEDSPTPVKTPTFEMVGPSCPVSSCTGTLVLTTDLKARSFFMVCSACKLTAKVSDTGLF